MQQTTLLCLSHMSPQAPYGPARALGDKKSGIFRSTVSGEQPRVGCAPSVPAGLVPTGQSGALHHRV